MASLWEMDRNLLLYVETLTDSVVMRVTLQINVVTLVTVQNSVMMLVSSYLIDQGSNPGNRTEQCGNSGYLTK
jgi:hypothetical protein